MNTTVWLFVIYCTANCVGEKKATNDFFNASTYEGCLIEAHKLINIRGLTGTWEVECKPYPLSVIDRPATGH